MTQNSDIQFPINQSLLESALKIKQERKIIKERLHKIEAKKNEVTPSVYQKVRQDYAAKLNDVTNALLEKKTDVDRELSALYETRAKVSDNFEQHKDVLEELKFRFELGEFDESKFKELSGSETDKITKFEKVLNAVNNNIERYEAIFADEDGIFESTEPSVKKKKPKSEKTTPHEAPPEGSDYILAPEEADYFTPEAEEGKTPVETSADVTKKTPITGEARVNIIEGGLAGQEYKLKGENTIGRASTNTIVIKDAKISRQHAVIKQTGAEFVIMDLNSSNGILVNHEKVKEHVLGDGDLIQIGDHVMQFKF